MSESITASSEKPVLRIISKFAFLFVVMGFFMPVCRGQTGFTLTKSILITGNVDIVVIMLFVFFIATLLSVLLLIPLVTNKKVPIGFDWSSLIVSILCCVFFILKAFSDRALVAEGLTIQMGGQYIFMGLVFSLVTLALSPATLFPNVKTLVKNNIRNYSMFIILAMILIIFGPLTDWRNWSSRNFTNIFFQYSYVLILAIGMVQVIIVQGIDLSVGSVCAMVGALSAMIYNTGIGMPVTLLASLGMGAVIGAYQGAWVAFAKIPAFIVTLSGMMLFRGITYFITKMNPVSLKDTGYSFLSTGTVDEILKTKQIGPYFPAALVLAVLILLSFIITEFFGRRKKIANGFDVSPFPLFITQLILVSLLILGLADRLARYRGLPVAALVLGITIAVFHFLLNNTVLGRFIFAVGGNPRSAKLSGINSEMVTFIVFCFMGGLTGLAAMVYTGYINSALPDAGNLFELDAIAACYIGGVSAGGGIGSVIGVIVGGLVMCFINNGMLLMNLGTQYQYVVKASILILAVFYDVYSRRKAGLG